MEKVKIDRINELAHKAKTTQGLTEEEKAEREVLRNEYRAEFTGQLGGILDNTYLQRPDGTKEKLKPKTDGTC